jgi:acyl-CoA dehydrogenase
MGTKVLKHGMRASHTADVFLDDCRVPGRCLLGGKDKLDERIARAREGTRARKQAAMSTFEVSRPTVAGAGLGDRPRRLRVRARIQRLVISRAISGLQIR